MLRREWSHSRKRLLVVKTALVVVVRRPLMKILLLVRGKTSTLLGPSDFLSTSVAKVMVPLHVLVPAPDTIRYGEHDDGMKRSELRSSNESHEPRTTERQS